MIKRREKMNARCNNMELKLLRRKSGILNDMYIRNVARETRVTVGIAKTLDVGQWFKIEGECVYVASLYSKTLFGGGDKQLCKVYYCDETQAIFTRDGFIKLLERSGYAITEAK